MAKKAKKNTKPTADAVVKAIHDMLYLVTDFDADLKEDRYYDPDKEWSIDLIEEIARVIELRIPRPKQPKRG